MSCFSQSIGDLRDCELSARIADDPVTRRDAFSLRYRGYVSGGYIKASEAELFHDDYDDGHCSNTIVVYAGYDAIASARVSLMDVEDGVAAISPLPAYAVFPDKINALVQQVPQAGRPRRAAEVTRLVRHPGFAEHQGLVLLLLRLLGYVIVELEADILLACVRRNHVPFYRKLGLQKIAGPRLYPNLNFETYLLARPCRDLSDAHRVRPALHIDDATRSSYAGLFEGKAVSVSMEACA
jgi:hypothetical protein